MLEPQKAYDIFESKCNSKRFYEREAYASGRNPVIFQERQKSAPDNRIPVPFCKKAVSLYSGYMAKPGNIVYHGDFYESILKDIYNDNEEELETSEELKTALKHGAVYELHWTENGGKEHYFSQIPVNQGVPVYTSDLKPKLSEFIWCRKIDGIEHIKIWDFESYAEYQLNGSVWRLIDEGLHGYGQVPVNIGAIAADGSNLFDHVLELIDFYDKLISGELANEAQRYSNALLMFAERFDTESKDANGLTMVDRLKELGLLDGMGTPISDKAAFLTKDIPVAFIEYAIKTCERLIYEMIPLFNPNDDNFAAASGRAQKYKLLGFEYRAAEIEAYFMRFLQNRIRLISNKIKALGENPENESEVTIRMNRNLPEDLIEMAEVATALKGVLSDKTIIGLFPASIVANKEDELKQVNDQESRIE